MPLVLPGATSGSITVDVPATAGTNTITIPANTGTIITTGSSGQSIPKAALPTGSVLQVVNATYSTSVSTSGTSYVDTGLTASITPSSSSSKILVIVHQIGLGKDAANASLTLRLLRGATSLIEFENNTVYTNTTTINRVAGTGCCYLDSPATTSSTTYKTQLANPQNAGNAFCQINNSTSTITLMEIAA